MALRKHFIERTLLACVLPVVAGAVNASGFLEIGVYTSHVTGHVAKIGDELAQGNMHQAWGEAALVFMFLAGAITSSTLIEMGKRRERPRYVAPLLLQATVLAAFAVWAAWHGVTERTFELAGVLCFAMGLQNAMVTKTSSAVVRSTHLTGIVTDIGVELTRLGFWLRERPSGERGAAVWRREWGRLRLHCVIFASFFLGAVAGPELFLHGGHAVMALPCAILIALAIFDRFWGLDTAHREA